MIHLVAVQEDNGNIVTSVLEFKLDGIKLDQSIAEMLCTVTNCSVDVLRSSKQISKAIIFGLSVDYNTAKTTVHKMILNFIENRFQLFRLKDEMTISGGLNFVIAALSN